MVCPVNCAVRLAIIQVPPEKQTQLIAYIMDATHSRTEVADQIQRECGRKVYPGSITRHRSHYRESEDVYVPKVVEQAKTEADHQTMLQYVDAKITDFKALSFKRPVMTQEEITEATLAILALKKTYYQSIANPNGEIDFSTYYTDFRCQTLTNLYEAFRPQIEHP